MELDGAQAVITGAGSGLGEATALHLTTRGAKPCLLDIDAKRVRSVAERLQVPYAVVDVCNESAVQAALETFGRLDILVNCAGIAPARKVVGSRGVHPLEEFQKTISVNLVGSFNVARLVAQRMVQNTPNVHGEKGVIVHTASIAAFDGQVGQAAYAASKGGIVSMTLPMARELSKHGIRVVSIAPGLFKTAMLEALPAEVQQALAQKALFPARLGAPREYAMLVENILKNPMLNGSTIRLDGAVRLPPQ